MSELEVGTLVRVYYRIGWVGELLASNDPLAWAGTMAFPGTSLEDPPDQSAVDDHLASISHLSIVRTTRPVLWTFGKVYWERTEVLEEVL